MPDVVRVKLSTILLLMAGLLALLLVTGVLALQSDWASRRLCQSVRQELARALGAEVEVHACGIGLVPPAVEIQGLSVRRPDGPEEISAGFLRFELDSLSLVVGRLSLDRVRVDSPRVHLVLRADGRLTWPVSSRQEPSEQGGGDLGWLWPERAEVRDATVRLEMEQGPMIELGPVELSLGGRPGEEMRVGLAVGGGRLQAEKVSEQLREMKLEARGRAGNVVVQEFVLDTPAGRLQVDGRVGFDEPAGDLAGWLKGGLRPDLQIRAELQADRLAELFGWGRLQKGALGLEARSQFQAGSAPWLEGQLRAEWAQLGGFKNLRFSSTFHLDTARVSLAEMRLQTTAGEIDGSGRLDFEAGKLPFEAELGFGELRSEPLAAALGFSSPLGLNAAGKVSLSGRLAAKRGPSVSAGLDLKLSQVRFAGAAGSDKLPAGALQGTVSWKSGGLSGEKLSLRLGRSQILGGFKWKPDGPWQADLSAPSLELEDFSALAGMELSGQGTAEARAAFSGDLAALLSVDLQSVVVEKRPLGLVKGSMRVAESVARLDNLLLRGPGGTVVMNGRVGLARPHPLGLLVDLSRTRLTDVLSVVNGESAPGWVSGWIGGQMQVSGSLEDPAIDFRVAVGDARVGAQPVPEAGLAGRLQGGAWHLELLQARLGDGWLYAQGDVSAEGQIDVSLFSTGLKADSFAWLAGLAERLDFRLDVNLSLKGALRSPVVAGWVKFYDTRWEGRSLEDSLLNASATASEVNLDGRLLGQTLVFEAQMLPEQELPLKASFKLQTENLERFLPAAAAAVTGAAVSARATLEGSLAQPAGMRASLQGEKLWINLGGLRIEAPAGFAARLQGGQLQLEPLKLRGPGLDLLISGGADLKDGPRLELKGETDLGSIGRLVPGLTRISGRARLETWLQGPWAEARPAGAVEFEARNVELRSWPDPISELRGRLRMDPDGLEVVSLDGTMGDGSFSGLGRMEWAAGRPLKLNLGFDIDGVRTRVTQNIWGRSSGALQLAKEASSRLRLSGRLTLSEGGYREKLTLSTLSQGLFRRRLQAARAYSTKREVLDFDLELVLPENFRVEYDLSLIRFAADMRGSLKVVGTNERLGLLGELTGDEGTVNYLTKDFSLQEARVNFVDQFSILPEVRTTAQRNEMVVRSAEEGGAVEYRLLLELMARGDQQPQLKLSSDPALDERDIVALLNLGVITRDLETLRGEDLVGLGGEILSRSLQFDEKLGRLFPFPPQVIQPRYLRVRSGYSTAGGAQRVGSVSPRLEVGAKLKLISNDLDVDYSRSLYDDTDQNLDFTYRLSRRVSARLRWEGGEKDTPLLNVGDLGLDLRLQWEW